MIDPAGDLARAAVAAFRVKPGERAGLADRDPRDASLLGSKEEAKARTDDDARAIDVLQDRLYAEGRRALLVVLQGTDTSGKDGTIRGVFNATGPLGVTVTAFQAPTWQEAGHDYLWRVHAACPRRGTIGIFNRSHYEDVLAVKVRGLAPPERVEERYDQINAFERHLVQNGTTILKFMLHISRKEQGSRLQERLDDPAKRWKFSAGDLEDRERWDEYQEAYEAALTRCSTAYAPWHVIPADRKWARNAAIAAIVRGTLEAMGPTYPEVDWDPDDFVVR